MLLLCHGRSRMRTVAIIRWGVGPSGGSLNEQGVRPLEEGVSRVGVDPVVVGGVVDNCHALVHVGPYNLCTSTQEGALFNFTRGTSIAFTTTAYRPADVSIAIALASHILTSEIEQLR